MSKKLTKKTLSDSKRSSRKVKRSSQNSLPFWLGTAFVLVGLIVGGISLFKVWHDQHSTVKPKPLSQVLSRQKTAVNDEPLISGSPVRISVPSVNIDLKVIPGYYYPSSQSWTLSDTDAQFATMTAKPNNKAGDTFIYGHALMNVFGRLPKIQTGAQATITADNGHTFTYTFQTSSIVTPGDTSLFTYQGQPVLILQTCTGTHFQNRQLFVFNLSKVS